MGVSHCNSARVFLGELPAAKSLIVFKRNDQSYYVFQQILETCFPKVPQSTVRRWLQNIGTSAIRTNSLERQHLNALGLMPYRFLISADNLLQLVEHSKTRRKYNKKYRSQLSSVSVSSIVNVCLPPINSCTNIGEPSNTFNATPSNLHVPVSNIVLPDAFPYEILQSNSANSSTIMDISSACTDEFSNNLHDANAENLSDATIQEIPQLNSANSSTISNACTDESSNNLHDANAENPQSNSVKNCSSSDDLSNSCKATSSIKIGCLKRQDMCPELQLEIDGLSDFYTLTVNPLRTCSAFSASTMRKFLERVKCFLNFCRIKYPERKLDFTFVNDVDVVYITYQLDFRLLNISTVVRTITVLINLAKYIHRASEDIDSCIQLVRLKNVQRQQSHRLATKAGLCGNKTSTFMFQHLLDTIKSLREKVDSYRGSPRHTRILHNFVLISLCVTSMCGRSKEIRTLQLFNECVEGKEFHFDWKTKCNVFVVSADEGKFTLYENDFKNLRSHGPSKFEIDSSM